MPTEFRRSPQPDRHTCDEHTATRTLEQTRTEVLMRRVRSEDLLRGDRILEIFHGGEVYRLQSTRLGKLILTK